MLDDQMRTNFRGTYYKFEKLGPAEREDALPLSEPKLMRPLFKPHQQASLKDRAERYGISSQKLALYRTRMWHHSIDPKAGA